MSAGPSLEDGASRSPPRTVANQRLVADLRRSVAPVERDRPLREGNQVVLAHAHVLRGTAVGAVRLGVEEHFRVSVLQFDLLRPIAVLQCDDAHSALKLEGGVALMLLGCFERFVETSVESIVRVHGVQKIPPDND